MLVITWIVYILLAALALGVAGAVIVFIGGVSVILGGALLSFFVASYICYLVKEFFRRS